MSGEKKVFVSYTIRDRGGDLSRNWYVEFYDGAKRRKLYRGINQHRTAKGRREAAKKLIKHLKAERLRKVTRVEEAIRKYINDHWGEWGRKTREQYRSSANVFLGFLAGRELTQELVEEFLQQVRTTKHATTYNRYVAYVKRFLKYAGYEFLIEDIKRVRANPTPARYFQRHQAQRILKVLDERDAQLGLFVRFIYYCFIRPGELRQLKVGDILLEDEQIRIPGEVSKNRKTQFVAIPKAFVPLLDCLYDRAPGEYLFASARYAGMPVGKNGMYLRHKAVLTALNFGAEYSLYSWKHTGAVAAAKAGISVKELQLQLRHHSLDQTDQYLRQMGVKDLAKLQSMFPAI